MQLLKKKSAPVDQPAKPTEGSGQKVANKPTWLTTAHIMQVVGGLLILFVLFALVQLLRSRNIYAVVDKRVITTQTYQSALKANRSYAQNVVLTPPAMKDITKFTKDQIMLDAALQNSAATAKVTVDQREIDAALLHIGLKDKKVIGGRAEYKKVLGWSDADVDRYGRIQALENKLASHELKYLDLLHSATYWTKAGDESLAKQTLGDKAEPLFKAKKTSFEIFAVSNQGTQFAPTTIATNHLIVASVTDLPDLQRDADSKLKKIGDYTPVTRGDGPLYFIDRLEDQGTGSYKSWDAFTTAAASRAKLYKGAFDIQRLKTGFNLQ